MDHSTWHKSLHHNSIGECDMYGDHCTVAIREAAHAEALLMETMGLR